MSYKIFVTDIDGTIRTRDNMISDAVVEAIVGLEERGIPVVIASGRAAPGLLETARDLHMAEYDNTFLMSFNGGTITECRTGKILKNITLPLNTASRIWALSKKYDVDIVTFYEDALVTNNTDNPYFRHEAEICTMRLIQVEDFRDYDDIPLSKIMFGADPKRIEQLAPVMKKMFEGEFDVFISEPQFLEFVPPGINKGDALAFFEDYLGITRDEILACGDSGNDAPMVAYAGLGVAMDNALPPVKEVADYIAGSVQEDGVVDVIRKFF